MRSCFLLALSFSSAGMQRIIFRKSEQGFFVCVGVQLQTLCELWLGGSADANRLYFLAALSSTSCLLAVLRSPRPVTVLDGGWLLHFTPVVFLPLILNVNVMLSLCVYEAWSSRHILKPLMGLFSSICADSAQCSLLQTIRRQSFSPALWPYYCNSGW